MVRKTTNHIRRTRYIKSQPTPATLRLRKKGSQPSAKMTKPGSGRVLEWLLRRRQDLPVARSATMPLVPLLEESVMQAKPPMP